MPRSAPVRRPAAPSVARQTRNDRASRAVAVAAVRMFAEHGYRETTPEQVAGAAEVTPLVVARRFDDKPSLFQAALDEVRTATLERWRTETAALPDALTKLHAVAEQLLDAGSVESRFLHRALLETDEQAVATLLRAYLLECETFLAGLLIEGQQAGVFRRNLDPRVGAWALLRNSLGHALTAPLELPLDAEAEARSAAIECLLHGLAKTDV